MTSLKILHGFPQSKICLYSMKSLHVFCICPVKSFSILTSAQQLHFLVTDDDMKLEALGKRTYHWNWLIYSAVQKRCRKKNVLHPLHAYKPPVSRSPFFTIRTGWFPLNDWWIEMGAALNYAQWGSTFLFSLKIAAYCSILCYGRCVPMGWFVEQRMGESKPACSSKQVLHAFEDARWLQAKVGLEEEMCILSGTQARIHTHSKVKTKTFDPCGPQSAAWQHVHASKEVLEREQIAFTRKVKVMRALLSKDIWSIIHCLCLQLVQWE